MLAAGLHLYTQRVSNCYLQESYSILSSELNLTCYWRQTVTWTNAKGEKCHQFVVLSNDCHSKLMCVNLMSKIHASHVRFLVSHHFVISYEIAACMSTNNGPQLFKAPLETIRSQSIVKWAMSSASHGLINGQAKQYSLIEISKLQIYVFKHHRTLNTYVQPLMCSCNTKIHWSTSTSSSTFIVSCLPRFGRYSSTDQSQPLTLARHRALQAKCIVSCIVSQESKLYL